MEEEVKPPRKAMDRGVIIGVVAIVINLITVSVYMYQASIMQTQQHAAAWPYLEWLPSFNEEQYFIEISNNGIGPALIKSTRYVVNGQEFPNIDSVFIKLIGTDYFPHLTSTVQNRVLPPGKSIRLFQINDSKWAGIIFDAMRKQKFEFEICYESIYGDQWTCKGVDVAESRCTK